jgi:hypothetical protein
MCSKNEIVNFLLLLLLFQHKFCCINKKQTIMLLFGLFFCAGYIPQCYRHYYKASGKYLITHCFDFVFTPNLLFIEKMSRIR